MDTAFNILDGGKLRLYDGTQPTDADTALGAQVVLADLGLNATAFAAAAGSAPAAKVANAISDDTSADATGTCTWGSLLTSANVRVMDFSVTAGGGGGDMTLNTTSIVAGAKVSCTALQINQSP